MVSTDDILQPILIEDIPKLRDLYSAHLPKATHAFNFLNITIKWKSLHPEKNYITLMSPHGNWHDGTFVALLQWSCYDLLVFTLEKHNAQLYDALNDTNLIDWEKSILFYAVHNDHINTVLQVLHNKKIEYSMGKHNIWRIPKERALTFEVDLPTDVYVRRLRKSDAFTMDQIWPPRYDTSQAYLETLIELNGGYGLCLKSNDQLISWGIKNHIRAIGVLQTLEEHKRKGYASLVTKIIAKDIAEDGADPVGTIHVNNIGSANMISRLGFEKLDIVAFIQLK